MAIKQIPGQATGAQLGAVATAGAVTISFPRRTTSGNTLLLVIVAQAPTSQPTFTVADNFSNNWRSLTAAAGLISVQIYAAFNCQGGSGHQVTVTANQNVTLLSLAIDEFFGTVNNVPTPTPYIALVSNNSQPPNELIAVWPLTNSENIPTDDGGLIVAAIGTTSPETISVNGATLAFSAAANSNGNGFGYAAAATTGAPANIDFPYNDPNQVYRWYGRGYYFAPAPFENAVEQLAAAPTFAVTHQNAAAKSVTGAHGAPTVTHNLAHVGAHVGASPHVIASEKTPALGRIATTAQVIASEKTIGAGAVGAAGAPNVSHNVAAGETHFGAAAAQRVPTNSVSAAGGVHALAKFSNAHARLSAAGSPVASSITGKLAALRTAIGLLTNRGAIDIAGLVRSAGSVGPPAKAKLAASPTVKSGGVWKLVQQAADAQYGSSHVTVTFPNDVIAGNLIMALAVAGGNSESAPNLVEPQDTLGNTFQSFGTNFDSPFGTDDFRQNQMAIYLAIIAAGGDDSFTIFWTNPAQVSGVGIAVFEYQPPQPGITIGAQIDGVSIDGTVEFSAGGVSRLAAGDMVLSAIAGAYPTPPPPPFATIATPSPLNARFDMAISTGQSSLEEVFHSDNGSQLPSSFSVPIYAVGNAVTSGSGRFKSNATIATDAGNVSLTEHLAAAVTRLSLSQVTHSEAAMVATAFVSPGQAVEASIAAALRLVASSLYAAAGRIAALAAPQVASNIVAGEGHAAATTNEIVSQIVAGDGDIGAVAMLKANNIENVVSRVTARPAVLAGGVYHAEAGVAAAPLLRASSRYQARAGLATIGKGRFVSGAGQVDADALVEATSQFVHLTSGVATELKTVASQAVSATLEFTAAGHPHVASNSVRLIEHATVLTDLVNHTGALAAASLAGKAAERVAHNLADAALEVETAALALAKTSNSRPRATGGAVATVVASSPLRAQSNTAARATIFASGQHVAAEAGLAFDGVPRSSDHVHPSSTMRLDAIVLASGVKTVVAGVRSQLSVLASSLTASAIAIRHRASVNVAKNVARVSASAAAGAAQTVPHNLAVGDAHSTGTASGRVPHNIATVTPAIGAVGAINVKKNSATVHDNIRADGVLDVLTNHVAALERLALHGTAIVTTNLAEVSIEVRGEATRIVSQIVAALADLAAGGHEQVWRNLAHGQASLDALAELVNRTARAVESGIVADADPINHEFLAIAEHLESLAAVIAKSSNTGGTEGRGGAVATVIASSLFGGTADVRAAAAVSSPNKQMAVAAWVYVEPLSPGNDSLCQLLGIQDEDGNYLTDEGPITCVVTDPENNTVATLSLVYLGTPVNVAGRSFADGNWSATLPGAVSLVAGTTYCLTFQSSNPVLEVMRYETAQTRSA